MSIKCIQYFFLEKRVKYTKIKNLYYVEMSTLTLPNSNYYFE